MRLFDILLLHSLFDHESEDSETHFGFPDPVCFSEVDPISKLYSDADACVLICGKICRERGVNAIVQPVFFENCDVLFYCVILA